MGVSPRVTSQRTNSDVSIASKCTYRFIILTELCVFCSPFEETQKLVPPLSRLLAPQTVKVFTGLGINHLTPDLDADLTVFVKDAVICHTFVNAEETIIERTHIGETTCKTKSSASISLAFRISNSGREPPTKDCKDALHLPPEGIGLHEGSAHIFAVAYMGLQQRSYIQRAEDGRAGFLQIAVASA
jgi:hypothetical protein